MSFLKKREPENRGVKRLPKQAHPPTLKQLQAMLQECTQVLGSALQISFGDAPEDYTLGVIKDRMTAKVHWALYRGEGESSLMLWDQTSSDPGFVHALIVAQFPGLDLKPLALRPTGNLQKTSQVNSEAASTPEGKREQQSTTLRMRKKPTLEGDLKNIPITNVVQSISLSNGTGKLEIDGPTESATVFFADGMPIHAISRGLEGESSFIELISWEEGEFRFYPGSKHEETTIKRKLETLLMEGMAIDDQYRELLRLGANENAFLLRKHQGLTEKEFEKIVEPGTGTDLDMCKRLYLKIDGRTRLIDLVHRLNLTKLQWVPALFNLATCQLIACQDQIDQINGALSVEDCEVEVDWAEMSASEKTVTKADTGIYTYSAFLYFLRLELWRWERFGRPFSVVLLQVDGSPYEAQGPAEPLSVTAAQELAERMKKLKSKTDILGHYETFGFAFLLRETDLDAANSFAGRMVDSISGEPLQDGLNKLLLHTKVGVACIPDDCSTLGALLARAKPRSMAEALTEAREKVRSVIDNALDLICTTDQDLRLVEINPACETALGYRPDQLLGKNLTDMMEEADVEPSIEKIRELMSARGGSRRAYLENRLVKKDGTTVHFQWSMRWSPEKRMMFWVGRDITSQKELEKLKNELIRMISHDLRSPAMAVDTFLEIIEGKIGTPVENDWGRMHKAAQVASSRMIKLISDLLAYEHIQESMVKLSYSQVSVQEIFEQSLASVAVTPQVNVQVNPTDLGLECDGDRVVQIVVNLLGNAIKFSPPGATVTLSAAAHDNQIVISVSDTGPGISPEHLDTVFLPFKQISEHNKGKAKGGFGLGLAIARAFAEMHGGKITVQSTVGSGTSFHVWLPQKASATDGASSK